MATYASIKYDMTLSSNATGAGSLILLSTQTASDSNTIDFTSRIDSKYDEYVFKFYDIHPETDNTILKFNASVDSGSNYNVTKTTSSFDAFHSEADDAAQVGYNTSHDLAQSTSVQTLLRDIGNGNDESASGYLRLFNPSSTTFVKHFLSEGSSYQHQSIAIHQFNAGYFNTTSAIDAIQFSMSDDSIQSGTIKMYGVS
jgi:hypothetical protein